MHLFLRSPLLFFLSPSFVVVTAQQDSDNTPITCGCNNHCTEAVLQNYAGGQTCLTRIKSRLWFGESEEVACTYVAERYPLQCGPQCHPKKCGGKAPAMCNCPSCTPAVWMKNADGFTCGQRYEFSINTRSEKDSCRRIAEFHPEECGACNPDTCLEAPPSVPEETSTVETSGPTERPTMSPVFSNDTATIAPTLSPSISSVPTSESPPSVSPTGFPSDFPSLVPSARNTEVPYLNQTINNTQAPSTSAAPSVTPTAKPTLAPSVSTNPTTTPTDAPTAAPSTSLAPTMNETLISDSPSQVPTNVPTTLSPTNAPTNSTDAPSSGPSDSPTAAPTTGEPTVEPSPDDVILAAETPGDDADTRGRTSAPVAPIGSAANAPGTLVLLWCAIGTVVLAFL